MAGAPVVLIVDDDAAIRALLRELLHEAGYASLEAADGLEAIRLLEDDALRARICLVLLDLNMPRADGIAVLQHLAAGRRMVPVVAMSANIGQLLEARRLGVAAALEKPFELDTLLALVGRLCGDPS
ncbi:MAG: response regulator [Chloroflexi bacterium]|nr:response regulator [Chloroflexota bacterium]